MKRVCVFCGSSAGETARFLDHAVQQGFLARNHRRIVQVESDPEALLRRLEAYEPSELPRWIRAGET